MLSKTNFKDNIQQVKAAAKESFPDNPAVADLMVAQAILESALYKTPSNLALNYNNLFGIKGKGTMGTIMLDTKEYRGGKWHTDKEPFAYNKTLKDSFDQFKKLLQNGTKDKPSRYHPVLQSKTFEEAARAIHRGGYATDPTYATKLINTYKAYIKEK